MDLYKEIIINVLKSEEVEINFKNLEINAEKIIELEALKALNKIKNIIEDDSYEDEDCFIKIEKIVREFEIIGSNGGNRHDFG